MEFERNSLPDQITEFLRKGIAAGRWSPSLPSESELCRELGVSRSTLRKAIIRLADEGLIVQRGRGAHHGVRKRSKAKLAQTERIIRVISPFSLRNLGSIQHVLLDYVAARLGAIGLRLEYEHRPALFNRHVPADLKRVCSLPDTAALMVFFSTLRMQQWFARNSIPCLIFGRTYEGISLPCAYPDLPVSGRHAANLFFQRGHREMAYFIARFTSRNDRLTAEAFVEEAHRLGARAHIYEHEADAKDVVRALGEALAKPYRPTAIFSACPEHCLAILCHFLNRGMAVPGDCSIITGWDDEFLNYAEPRISCYRIDGAKLGAKLVSILMKLLRDRAGLHATSILPTFVHGQTLGPAPRPPKRSHRALQGSH